MLNTTLYSHRFNDIYTALRAEGYIPDPDMNHNRRWLRATMLTMLLHQQGVDTTKAEALREFEAAGFHARRDGGARIRGVWKP